MRYPTSRQKTAKFFFALGHPRRLKIIEILEQHPNGLTYEAIGKIACLPDASLSHHLRILGEAGLHHRKIKDRFSIYTLNRTRLNHMLNRPATPLKAA